MNSLVSLIVPVYNAEKYLPRCIMSILKQSYNNIELILVNDGSPDKCGKICDEYAKKDKRIKVIHKQNGGVSDARNVGIDTANGEYIAFVDSDDFLSENCIEILSAGIKSADLSAGSIVWHKKNANKLHSLPDKILLRDEIISNIIKLTKQLDGSACAKLFKRNIINVYNLRFGLGIPMCEDTQFLVKYLGYCASISTSSEAVYTYDLSNETSAVKKYYEDYDKYVWALYESYVSAIEYSALNREKKTLLKCAVADMLCCDSIRHYLPNINDRKKLLEKVHVILKRYSDYLNVDAFELSDVTLISKKQFICLANNDAEGFLKLWQRALLIKRPVLILKTVVKRILRR